jgi:hypothetical protein
MEHLIFSLLPVIFMLHEFEEILFFKIWLHKDKEYLCKKFPKIGSKIYFQYDSFTTSGFVFAIAEEFLLISILTYVAILFEKEYLWFTVFMGFSIHIIIHIFQWIIYRKYLPTIFTSILILPYCIYGFRYFITNNNVNIFWIIISSIIGIVTVALNLKFIHYIGHKFSIYENRILNNK